MGVIALHDTRYLRDVDAVFAAAQAAGHVGVDLHNHPAGLFTHGPQMRGAGSKVEVTVGVHGGYLEHRHIYGVRAFPVITGQLRVADGAVERKPLCNGFALNAAHVPAVPGHMGSRVRDLENLGHPHQDAAMEIDPFQLGQALGQGCIHRHRGVGGPAVAHPIAALHQGGSLGCGHLLVCIQCLEVHYKPSSPIII